jgi:hypothetical protein
MLKGTLFVPGQNKATATNDNASAGNVGEIVVSSVASGSAVGLTTATGANVTSISLTAGDWELDGQVDFSPAATTSVTQYNASVSLTSATLSPQAGGSGLEQDATFTINQAAQVPVSTFMANVKTSRLSIASTTTVFLVAQAVFTVSTLSAYGTIRARRIR